MTETLRTALAEALNASCLERQIVDGAYYDATWAESSASWRETRFKEADIAIEFIRTSDHADLIEVGDLVRLNSGGVTMTVIETQDCKAHWVVTCWFVDGNDCRGQFPVSALEVVP